MKYYFKHLFSYDWPKYLAIILACFLAWGGIFSVANRYRSEEKLTVFLCAYDVVDGSRLDEIRAAAADNGILRLNLNCYDCESVHFPTVLAVKGIYGSDLLILDEAGTDLYLSGGNALALTSELLTDLLGENAEAEIKYAGDQPAALLIYDSGNPGYSSRFDLSFLQLGDDTEPPTGKYYLIINGKSIHAAPNADGQTDALMDLCRVILSKS